MKLNRKDKLLIGIVIALALCVVYGASIYLENDFAEKSKLQVSFFSFIQPEPEDKGPAMLTVAEAEEAYEARPDFPSNFFNEFHAKKDYYLSCGQFTKFDEWLLTVSETYKETPTSDYGYTSAITKLRASLVVAIELENRAISSLLDGYLVTMQDPHVLASCILATPPSVQMQIFIDQHSLISPVMTTEDRTEINLREYEIEDEYALIQHYNLRRSEAGQFLGLVAYRYEAYDRTWELLLGMSQSGAYLPITLKIIDNQPLNSIDASYLKEFESILSDAQIDMVFEMCFFDGLEGEFSFTFYSFDADDTEDEKVLEEEQELSDEENTHFDDHLDLNLPTNEVS